MAKNKYDTQHDRNLAKYFKAIEDIYASACHEAAQIGMTVGQLTADTIFAFKDFPITHDRIKTLMSKFCQQLEFAIVNGVESEWTLANNKNNALSQRVFGDNIGKLTKEQYSHYFNNHDKAREAFVQRQTAGLKLSDRVWNYTNQFQREIEMGLDVGIRSGRSADELSRDLRDYLKHPDKLFRRVRDEHGELQLSKAAQAFHSGRGVYRSSYKNARRLAATETNIAYRTADYLRYQDLDFVVGIKIVLSNNHPSVDICDDLSAERGSTNKTGRGCYPKTFKFTGWHPHCRCHVETILKTEEEIVRDTERLLNGEEPVDNSENTVKNLPNEFSEWVKKNANRMVKANTLPYFVTDNTEAVVKIMQKAQPSAIVSELMQRTAYFDEYALYYKRHSDKVASLLREYEKQDTDMGQAIVLNQIKHECASLTNQELIASGHISKDWTWARTEFDAIVQQKETRTVGNKVIKLDEVKMDILVYKDNEGREFAYAIGTNKSLFKATEASKAIQELPPYLRSGIKRVTFYDMVCPADPYWKVAYNNPNHRSMATDGGKTTFFLTPQSMADFKAYMTHEAGHIIDKATHRFSSSKGWQEACKKDEALHSVKPYRISSYAQTNDCENFAECVRAYYNDHETFKQMFPNCAAYIRQTAQKLSGHFKTP
jgi:hypothetical protein